MDPDACLQRIADADTEQEIAEACADLHTWCCNGGFKPNWDACPKGTKRYRAFLQDAAAWKAGRQS